MRNPLIADQGQPEAAPSSWRKSVAISWRLSDLSASLTEAEGRRHHGGFPQRPRLPRGA
jgi:hypothetical protein